MLACFLIVVFRAYLPRKKTTELKRHPTLPVGVEGHQLAFGPFLIQGLGARDKIRRATVSASRHLGARLHSTNTAPLHTNTSIYHGKLQHT